MSAPQACEWCDLEVHWHPCSHPERPLSGRAHFHRVDECTGCRVALQAAAVRDPDGPIVGVEVTSGERQTITFAEAARTVGVAS